MLTFYCYCSCYHHSPTLAMAAPHPPPLSAPHRGFAFDPSDNLYIADIQFHVIRAVSSSTGIISTVAGTGTAGYDSDGVQRYH